MLLNSKQLRHLMRLWYFSSSVNSFFKRACTAISGARCLIFGRILRLLHVCELAQALVRLCGCTGSPEPSLVTYVDKYHNLMSWLNSYWPPLYIGQYEVYCSITLHVHLTNVKNCMKSNFVTCTASFQDIWAPSSEFVSSSIPSWQILTAHAQPFRGARDLAFCLKVTLDSLLVWESSGGSGETARMNLRCSHRR